MNTRRKTLACLVGATLVCAICQVPAQEATQDHSGTRELHVLFTNDKARSIDDVQHKDVQVIENGAVRSVDSLSSLELPVDFALVVDNSGSMRSQFSLVMDTAKAVVEANRPGDEAFIVSLLGGPNGPNLIQEKTSDKTKLLNALNALRIVRGQTQLIDALYGTTQELSRLTAGNRTRKRRSAVVLISDGEDRVSSQKENELFKLLQKSDVRVFVIGLVEELDAEGGIIRKAPRDRARALIERLAKETGGRAFYPRSREDFESAVSEITRNLQRQYVITYRGDALAPDASYKVEIKVADGADKKKRRAILKPRYRADELQQP